MAEQRGEKPIAFTEPDWLKTDPEFRAWVDSMPQKYWAKYDLGACRLGWHAARTLQSSIAPTKITQTVMGKYGNCQSACLAMMLGLPLESVPNFAQLAQDTGDNEAYAAQGAWLRERGWGILTVVKWQSLPWPPRHGYFIAGGPSPRGHRHAVIYKDGALWHDPHPEGGGISEVQDIDFLYPLNPCAPRATSACNDWNTAIDKALLACEAEQAKYSREGNAAMAVRGALEYAMFAIRALRRADGEVKTHA